MEKPEGSRRQRIITFGYAQGRNLFGLNKNEILLDVQYNQSRNKVVVTVSIDSDEKEGDI